MKEEIEIKKCVLLKFINMEDVHGATNDALKRENVGLYLVFVSGNFMIWSVEENSTGKVVRRITVIPEEYIKPYVDMELDKDDEKKEGWVSAQTLLKTIELLTKK